MPKPIVTAADLAKCAEAAVEAVKDDILNTPLGLPTRRAGPTGGLMFEEREVVRDGVTKIVRILCSEYVLPDGTVEWRDVPMRRLRRAPVAAAK